MTDPTPAAPTTHIESCENETAVWYNDHGRCQCWCHDDEQENRRMLTAMREARDTARRGLTEEESARWDRAVESGEAVERLRQIRPEPIIEAAWQAGYDQAKAEAMLAQPSARDEWTARWNDFAEVVVGSGLSSGDRGRIMDAGHAAAQACHALGRKVGAEAAPQALDVKRLLRIENAMLRSAGYFPWEDPNGDAWIHKDDEGYVMDREQAVNAALSRLPSEEGR